MSGHHVEISLDHLGRGSVSVGGYDVSEIVTGLQFGANAGERPVVLLELGPRATRFTSEGALVTLGPQVAEALKALGWTPPAQVSE